MKAVLWSKTIITEKSARVFHGAVAEAVDRLEESGQMFGWSITVISETQDEYTPPAELLVPHEAVLSGCVDRYDSV